MPPMETMRLMTSMLLSERKERERKLKCAHVDVRRAHFHSAARREVYVRRREIRKVCARG